MFCCRHAVESLCAVAEKPEFKKKRLKFAGQLKCAIFSHIFSCPVEPGAYINLLAPELFFFKF